MTNSMKLIKILAATLPFAAALSLSSCQTGRIENVGIDQSKKAPVDLAYDTKQAGPKNISLTWDADDAIKAGAASLTVQLTKTQDGEGDNYDSKVTKTIQATDDPHNAVIFSDLTEYDEYFVRIRANYPRSVYSPWVYLQKDGSLVKVSVGHGIVVMEFVAPGELTVVAKNYSSAEASWGVVGPADGYSCDLKKAGADWAHVADTKDCTVALSDLEPETSYSFRVRSYRTPDGGTEKEYTEYSQAEFTTPAKPQFDPNIKTKEQLVEFLSTIAAQAGASDKYTLVNDIDMGGAALVGAMGFAGQFDGAGKAIKNAVISDALFGINAGVIKNLTIDKTCKVETSESVFAVIAEYNQAGGTLENCKNCADISVTPGTSIVLAGVVAINEGALTGCENAGNITVKGASTTPVVGGVCATATSSSVSKCVNTGNVTITLEGSATDKESAASTAIGTTLYPTVGGVCAIMSYGLDMTKGFTECTNKGAVSVSYSSASFVRTYVAGIAGTCAAGYFESCVNDGDITMSFSTGAVASSGKQLWTAGITNCNQHDDFKVVDKYGHSEIRKCTNNGTIKLDSDYSGANNYLGGIVSTPDNETTGAFDQPISECVNNGKVIAEGYGKTRAAGIAACAGNFYKCINYGEVVAGNNLAAASNIGGIVGFTNGVAIHPILECENYGNITCTSTNAVVVGGLFAQSGGTTGDGTNYSGNIVKCTVKGDAANKMGMISGTINNKPITLGTAEKPNQIAGKFIKGDAETTISEANVQDYITEGGVPASVKAVVVYYNK